MNISYSDESPLTCPRCGHAFEASIWLLLDAQERPDLLAALRAGQLNVASCPQCGHSEMAGAPLLYHDAAARRLVFAPPEGAREYEQREMLRELHTLLMSSIPEEQQRAYLGDVQITQGLDGLRSILEKDARRVRARQGAIAPASAPNLLPPGALEPHTSGPAPGAASDELPPLLLGVHELLGANDDRQIEQVLARYPALLAADADTMLAHLADTAANQREQDVAQALGEARRLLRRMRGAPDNDSIAATGGVSDDASASMEDAPAILTPLEDTLADISNSITPEAYAALLRARSEAELLEAARAHPVLLDAMADDALNQRVEAALDIGDERTAQAVEERREALADLRRAMAQGGALQAAIAALFAADDTDAMAAVIDTHPALLTDEAQQALWQISADANASGDEESAAAAVEYRALLREIRAGLNGT